MNNTVRAIYTILWVLEVLENRLTRIEEKLSINSIRPSKLDDIERESLILALKQAKGIQRDAARLLGITPRVINYKIDKYYLHDHCALRRKK